MEICWKLDASDWASLLPRSAAALQQSWCYGATINAMGGTTHQLLLRDKQRDVALVQVILRRMGLVTFGLISRGPIWLEPIPIALQRDLLQGLRRSLSQRGLTVLLITQERDEVPILPLNSPATLAELCLLAPPADLRKSLHVKWRNALVKAEKAGLEVSVTRNPNILVSLIERDQAQQRAKKYRSLPPKFIANWVRCAPDQFRVYRAMLGAEPVAEMLFLDHAPGVTYQAGWTGGAGRAFAAHNLLLWRAMLDFAALGCERMDLGPLDTVNLPGLARFKLGTGAQPNRLGATGVVLPRRLGRFRCYDKLSKATGRLL